MRVLAVESQTSRNLSRLYDSPWMVLLSADPNNDALSLLRHETFDLVLVDVASMGEDGLSFIRRVRMARNDTPLIAVTGGQADDGVRALGLGADDAFALPIDPEEFRARISAVIRRYKGYSRSLLQFGGLSLYMDTREVRFWGRRLALTGKEYSILELLVLRKGLVVTNNMLFNQLYGGKDEPDAKVLDVFICKLRKKLNSSEPTWQSPPFGAKDTQFATPGNNPWPALRRVLPIDLLHKLLSSCMNWASRESLPRDSRPMGAWRLPLQSFQHSDFAGAHKSPDTGAPLAMPNCCAKPL